MAPLDPTDAAANSSRQPARSQTTRLPRLDGVLHADQILLDLEVRDFADLVEQLIAHLVDQGAVDERLGATLERKIKAREQVASTAIGLGMACPHAFAAELDRPRVVFARLARPMDLGAPDGVPTDLVFLLIGREDDARSHLETLMHLARLLRDARFGDSVRTARTAEAAVLACRLAEARLAGQVATPSLTREGIERRTGRFAGGVRGDLRRRWPHYIDDFRRGLSVKALAATIFLYFACFSGAVTFGALMAASTGGSIGPFKMILATAICGVVYALCSGQPLVILGGTGPIFIFTAILYDQCQSLEVNFLATYACVGLWAALFTVLLALLDASVLLRWVTRFTDEIFVLLMAGIFIDEALKKLIQEFYDLRGIGGYASALSAVVLAVGTFGVAMGLRQIRRGNLLRGWARNFLADFGTVIAIVAMTGLSITMLASIDGLALDTITVPEHLELHLPSFRQLPAWVLLASAIPAALLAILIFLTQQITAKVCNAGEFNLQKGPGYHLDLLVVGLLLAVCSLLGLPWMCGATVRSLNHVNALASTHAADVRGGALVVTDSVLENRVSGLLIHVLVGLSLLFVSLLELIPMATLYGIFLYMGVASFAGNQFWQRLYLWIQEPGLYPPTHYLRRVPSRVVHVFTTVQLICFAALWAVKVFVGLLLPFLLALLIPTRLLLDRLFSPEHLLILDAEETPADEAEHWA